MFDDDRVLDDLKALDIYQIARDLGRDPNGGGFINCSFPNHEEKTPSMKLNQRTGRFTCFGCGKSGSTIDLYMSPGGMEFGEAVKEMKRKYLGIIDGHAPVPARLARPVVRPAEPKVVAAGTFSPMYAALQTFCRGFGPTEIKRQALAYLTGRAFTAETIRRFGLFVIPDAKATADFLTATYGRDQLEASGLFSSKGFMFWRHPLVIPYLSAGQIVNLQARCIGNPVEKQSKYQYLRSRPIITMFNADVLQNLAPGSKVYLTEGAFDAMAATQKNGTAVSINSSQGFKSEWVKLFQGLAVCFMFDSDAAGQKAIEKLTPLFQAEGIRVSKKSFPIGCKDVNEWLIKFSGQVNGYPAFWDQ